VEAISIEISINSLILHVGVMTLWIISTSWWCHLSCFKHTNRPISGSSTPSPNDYRHTNHIHATDSYPVVWDADLH